ncbi:MAG: amidohydrolase family protein [Rhodospirillales bacterium]|nr:amidohydrolase family protein [Rhodospirillales bacterium]
MTNDVLFTNALLLDTVDGALLEGRHVLVRDGLVAEVADGPVKGGGADEIDLAGKVLMPGLCDAHVHITAATANFAALMRWSPFYVSARTADVLMGMLMRGFTTVRDAGGADYGIAQAVDEGYFTGPRVLFGGKALSQTGGHGDMRGPGEDAIKGCFCCAGLGRICDGVDEVRRACRDEIRKGARHIKLMVAGGIASPTDRISSTQFSVDEMTAAVEEAEAAEIYVLGHAYTARAVNRALQCGVRSIEHGNLMDDSSSDLFPKHDAILVPPLSTFRALADEGALHLGQVPQAAAAE